MGFAATMTWAWASLLVCLLVPAAASTAGLLARVHDPAVRAALDALLGRLEATESELAVMKVAWAAAEGREAALLGRVGELERRLGVHAGEEGAGRASRRSSGPTTPSHRSRKQASSGCDLAAGDDRVLPDGRREAPALI